MKSSNDVAAVFAYSRDVARNGTESLSALVGAESAGDLLLKLDLSDIAFGKIVIEKDSKVIHESQYAVRCLSRRSSRFLGGDCLRRPLDGRRHQSHQRPSTYLGAVSSAKAQL